MLTIIGMVVGARRQRRAAEQEELARVDELRAEGKTALGQDDAPPAPNAPGPSVPASPPPVAAPPPASDEVLPATPDTADELIAAAVLDRYASPASVAADAPSVAATPIRR
ncbi:hypothetical protein AB5I41_24490 [Sphingomonas sp. MMS24-JH45]